jgi:PASTA domain-containing protein
MSDEREGRPRPDETRQFSPFEDEGDATGGSGWDHPDVDARSGDTTGRMPPADDPTALSPPVSGPGATSILPPVNEADAGPGAAAWAGRAEVRPPQPGYDTEPEWGPPPPSEPRGRWWMPILIGIVALILLALLGWGIWLIVGAQDGNTPATTPAVTTPVAPPSTEPTTEPTTEKPTTTPPTTEPTNTEVTVPALRGLSRNQAQAALSRRGLSSRLRFVVSDDAPAGTVIDSDPEEGQEVPPDTVVTLIIAAEPTTQPTTTSTEQPDED